ncbi:MAG: hypothetical protein M3O33_15120 [Cyanobacteriota bacterium]|nr:hypothetical protein [Cyanobacteriota bacterium]
MKELQAGIQLVKTKYIQLNRHSASKKKVKTLEPRERSAMPALTRSQPVAVKPQQKQVKALENLLLPFPIKSSLEMLRRRTTRGVRRLENQAKRINELSAELEAAVLELKAIASEINPDWKAIQGTHKSSSKSTTVCEYRVAAVPQVELKPDGSFILVSKPVDLFQAEREATLLAQTLRHRARKKRGLSR